jgi:hypothetical protein
MAVRRKTVIPNARSDLVRTFPDFDFSPARSLAALGMTMRAAHPRPTIRQTDRLTA